MLQSTGKMYSIGYCASYSIHLSHMVLGNDNAKVLPIARSSVRAIAVWSLLVCHREQYEVILQSPLSHVRAVELSQADVEKRFPRGTPSDCNNLFFVIIWKETETIEYIFACKQRFDELQCISLSRSLVKLDMYMDKVTIHRAVCF